MKGWSNSGLISKCRNKARFQSAINRGCSSDKWLACKAELSPPGVPLCRRSAVGRSRVILLIDYSFPIRDKAKYPVISVITLLTETHAQKKLSNQPANLMAQLDEFDDRRCGKL